MKKNLLKSILMAVALVLGTTGAWADEITATLVHTASSYSGTTAGAFTSTIDAEKEHINNSKFSGTWAGAAYAEFSITIPEGQTIQSATLTWNGVGSSKNRATDVMYANAGLTLNYTSEGEDALGSGTGKADLAATKITNVSFPANKTTAFNTDVTDAVKESAGQGYVIFKFTNNPGGGDLVGKGAAEGAPVLTIVTTDASAMTSYTVKFTDGAGNELKEAVKYDVLKGAEATASAADMAAFFNADNTMKYIYVSGNQTITATENAESNVITLVFREAEKWNYTINAVDGDGNALKTLKQGTNFEAEKFDVAYAAYINVNGTIYKSSKQSSDGKGYYFTLDLNADNVTKDITFTASDITGVVYFSEAEDIEGLTLTTNSNTFIRSSNGASAYAADGDVVFTTLPNGKYKLATVICDATKNAGSVWNFKAGEQNIFEFTAGSVNWAEGTSEEFELNAASTDIILVKNGGMNQGVDLIYIIKTGDAELAAPVAASGKMTFDGQPTSNNGTEGDITENKVLTADEFTVTVSPKTEGTTENRFWNNNGTVELRVYKGTITVKAAAGKMLNKIVFGQTKWGTMTASVGTLDAQTWTGEAEEVVFTVTAQCRINAITVGDYVAPAEPLADVANIAAFKALTAGTRAKLAVNGAKVTFVNGDNAFIEDETGALLLYKSGLTLTAGKAITGFINGAYTDHNGMPELTAIDETAASEITEADAEVAATVMTLAEAATTENVGKLVKLENVNINTDLQIITQGEGGEEYVYYDKFGVMAGFTYPEVIKSIDCILYVNKGFFTVHPVSPESVVAGIVATPCKEITEDYVFTMTAENVAKAVEETWAKGGATRTDNKKGTVDPATGETVEAQAFPGIGLKKGNDAKSFSTCIKGASKVIAYGATGSSTKARYLVVTATPTEGEAVTAKALSQPNTSAVAELELDAAKEYTIDYTGVEEDETTAGDVALHGVKFIAGSAEAKIPEAANIAAAKEEGMRDKEIKLNVTGAKVTLYGGNNMMESFIEDETGALMVDLNISKLLGEDGVTLTGYIIGKITKDQRQGGIFTFEGSENTASSEITKEATEIVPTATTIADINAGQVADVTSKFIRLENVNVKYESTGWSSEISLVDGDQELYVNDAMFVLPTDMSVVEKFNSISGIVIYGYYGLEFIPYGAYDAVEKQIEFTEVPNIAALKDIANDTDVKLALNNTQIKVLEGGRWDKVVYIEDETAGIQILDEQGTIFNEFGQTFNGYIYLKYKDEYGMKNLETAGYTKNSEYTVEVKEVVAKEVAWADAASANYNMQLIKVNNVELAEKTITEGEGEDASSYNILYLKSGDKEMNMSDMFSKAYDENGGSIEPGMYNITGIIMEAPVYNNNDEVSGYTDSFIPTGETAFEKVEEPEPVADLRKWDFTAWSDETKANLAAEAAQYEPATEGVTTLWRSYEKDKADKNGNYEPNETNGNAYWYGTAIAGSEELKANGTVIAETKGLLFNTVTAGALAIGVNYPSTSLGTYEGPSYLWIGGKNNSFTIPSVKSGSKITLGVESHKNTDARGVKLTINGEEIGSAVPTTYEVFNISVPGQLTDETISDVVVTNTNGCHIYFITVDATGNDGISDMNAVVKTINNDVYTINGVKVRNAGESLDGLAKGMYIIGGKKVVVK